MELITFSLPIITLYAETHFRLFRFLPSLLYKRWPEILFDMPRRLDPGHDLPILLICNDIDRFPIKVVSVEIVVSNSKTKNKLFVFKDVAFAEVDHPMDRQSSAYIFSIPSAELCNGQNNITAKATIYNTKSRKETIVLNDNLFSSTRHGFTTFIATNTLPCSDRCAYGDSHVHTQFSQSHVEFGPPVEVTATVALKAGLCFAAITDHSYDLACSMTDYFKQDANLPRWEILKKEVVRHSKKIALVCGEEVSCKNGRGRYVHLLALGIKNYIPGTGDGARRNTTHLPQLSLRDAIDRIHEQGGLAIAAHPGARSGYLQRILLGRGKWNNADSSLPLDALQASNGNFGKVWSRAKKLWLLQLANQKQIAIVAGNDTHGDFNRYRCIDIPFATIRENNAQYLGTVKTGLYGLVQSSSDVVDLIATGRTFVTDGPYCDITTNNPAEVVIGKRSWQTSFCQLFVNAVSNSEFGRIRKISVFGLSYKTSSKEYLLLQIEYLSGTEHQKSVEIPSEKLPVSGYIRVELITELPDKSLARAFTSPCYILR